MKIQGNLIQCDINAWNIFYIFVSILEQAIPKVVIYTFIFFTFICIILSPHIPIECEKIKHWKKINYSELILFIN